MKSKLTLLILILLNIVIIPTQAAWLNFVPQTITQPDGTVIHCFGTGDEYYNWLHDTDGFTIIQNHTDGYYYYAVLYDESLVPSVYRVDKVDPADAGLTPWTNIPAEKMEQIRADFLKNNMPEKQPLKGYLAPGSTKNEGTMNNLVVYIRFSDQSEFPEDTLMYYDMFNNPNAGYSSLQNYYQQVSYQMLSIPSWFYPFPDGPMVISYQDIYPRSYFMPYDPVTNPNGYQENERGPREQALLKRSIEFIDEEIPVGLDIDYDDDGYVDNMVFIVRGETTAWSTLLWPHRWVLYLQSVFINGKHVYDYNLQVENHLNSSGAGVLCHEMFHSLSAPDLYHYNSAPYTAVGPWDLMDASANPPQSMGAYMKFRYGGWINTIPEITECGTYMLNPLSEEFNNCFKIASPNSSSEYFVLEYRLKDGTFESSVPGTGLVVYRIDGSLNGNGNAQGPPDEVYVYRPGGTLSVNGNLDISYFGADYGRTEINDNTDPFPFLQNGSPGGLNISNIGYVGETISFDVEFEKEPVADFEASATLITSGCAVGFTDLSVCDVQSWLWSFPGGQPTSSTLQYPQQIVYNSPGTYDVSLTVTNPWGNNSVTKTGYVVVSGSALPEVIFYASDTITCIGSDITLNDFSEVCPDEWTWEIAPATFQFVSGTSASSQNPVIELEQAGVYSVSLTVANANGSATLLKENYLRAGGSAIPFTEDFENGLDDKGWTIVNPDNSVTWKTYDVAGNGGNKAAGINFFEYYSLFKRDQLISPPLDLSDASNAILHFEHAYALASNPNYSDSLIVKISSDCGNTWTRILELAENGSGNFATHALIGYNFIPTLPNDWCFAAGNNNCNQVDISQWAGYSDVRIMFESNRLAGNNLYIDNVQVEPFTGVVQPQTGNAVLLQVVPNPSSGFIKIRFNRGLTNCKLRIYNSVGQKVFESSVAESIDEMPVDLSDQGKGLYFIRITGAAADAVKKVLIR